MADKIPQHVAIIMDGNRRWAKKHGLSAIMGHDKAARDVIEPIVDHAIKLGIKFITFWAFSTENWKRDQMEIRGLMNIFRDGLEKLGNKLNEKGVKLNIIGEMSKFPKDIQGKTAHYLEISRGNKKITVSFALNYGGRDEILRAVRKLVSSLLSNPSFTRLSPALRDFGGPSFTRLSPALRDFGGHSLTSLITEASFAQHLDTADLPDPDLIIRTGGELRLSGYFPWQSVYSELYFTKKLWPEFTPAEFDNALADFSSRERRFGGNAKLVK